MSKYVFICIMYIFPYNIFVFPMFYYTIILIITSDLILTLQFNCFAFKLCV